jgi:hypothetical protein
MIRGTADGLTVPVVQVERRIVALIISIDF